MPAALIPLTNLQLGRFPRHSYWSDGPCRAAVGSAIKSQDYACSSALGSREFLLADTTRVTFDVVADATTAALEQRGDRHVLTRKASAEATV